MDYSSLPISLSDYVRINDSIYNHMGDYEVVVYTPFQSQGGVLFNIPNQPFEELNTRNIALVQVTPAALTIEFKSSVSNIFFMLSNRKIRAPKLSTVSTF